jgi:DNA-binding response OmpR family regulator
MDETKILIVEDDKDLSCIMRDYLVNEGYLISQVYTGAEAIETAKEFSPTLIILDIMLPGVDGIEVCRGIRTFSHCPILIISAKSSDGDKLLSLGMGADDYLTKPFSLPELVGRVKSHIRRFTVFANNALQAGGLEPRIFGALSIHPASYTASVSGREITLTSKEFRLLDFMSSHPSQVFSKEQLMDCVWGWNQYFDDNTIAVYVGRLREKLAKENVSYIKTVWGAGYKWEM